MTNSIFEQINNCVLDLQSATFQSYPQHIKKLARILDNDDLSEINIKLTKGLDLEAFINAGHSTAGSFVGSAHLEWPDDEDQILGLQFLLMKKFAKDPRYIENFGNTFYWNSSNKSVDFVRSVTRQLIIPFTRDYKTYVLAKGKSKPKLVVQNLDKIFIVHGHDVAVRESVARFIEKVGLEPIILHEQANQNMTIIEKIEAHANVGFAIVLLTPDDEGKAKSETEIKPRARQNVLLELGYFMAHLGRSKVCALKRGNLEIPNDFAGVLWEEFDDAGGWKQKLAKELEAAGYLIDWNKVMGT